MQSKSDTGSRGYLVSIVMVAVLGGLLFGYDTAVISGADKGLQAFFLGASDFRYTDFMHGFTSSSALIGCIIGSALSGLFATRFGRKRSLVFAGICFFLSAWGSMFPESMVLPEGKPSFTLLVAFNFYRILGGIGVGMASAICPMYIGEVAPSEIRGMLVSWNQFAIIFGQLVVYFVNFLILGSHTNPVIMQIGQGFSEVVAGSDPWTIACSVAHQRQHQGCLNTPRHQEHGAGTHRAPFLLRIHVCLHRHYAQRVPAGNRYQRRALLRSAHIRRYGHGKSNGADRSNGRGQHSVYAYCRVHR